MTLNCPCGAGSRSVYVATNPAREATLSCSTCGQVETVAAPSVFDAIRDSKR